MIAPTWFLLLVTLALASAGLMSILSYIIPADTFRFLFKEVLFPILIIGLIYIILGA